ncbi:hypothetical protein NDN01_15630 [Sphingomonas sp. QA11]|uniref:hypothetical protein n=1 Tax=Sphingomonas sp. QA11 TaxID=2950605 RepID=UPI00234A163F|nr:hypothetical protein [Sphingomonas sp. QA11]WCM25476.1 hypothetical protein NDN01_15630 [Sphingomonas sp. QA11]
MADVTAIRNALGALKTRPVPPWLGPTNPYQDGSLPPLQIAVAGQDLVEIIAVRGPLHAIDGWSYVARALNALISGDPHGARHLAYYGELRGALSILASSGIGIFNKRNAVVDVTGVVHSLTERATHNMCWATISQWALSAASLDQMVSSLHLGGTSLLDPFREFFPSGASVAASHLMTEWGFDLAQGGEDRDERNWSSYQPTALADIITTPADDTAFLTMFWESLRPGGIALERHLLRILLEVEARVHNEQLTAYRDPYDRLDDGLKTLIPFEFLTRVTDALDHDFLIHASRRTLPAHPYSMICRAALLLRLATGMAERNLVGAGIQPAVQFETWWREFGVNHGLWAPEAAPATSFQLWDDVDLALEDVAGAPTTHRHRWVSALAGSAMRVCETERAALWGLFQ